MLRGVMMLETLRVWFCVQPFLQITINKLDVLFLLIIIIVIATAWFLIKKSRARKTYGAIEVEEVKLGIGKNSITLKPQLADLEIAYKLWI